MSIANWPEGLRPREKLLKNGPEHLSDAELLAIFLRTGIHGKSAVDLAQELLEHFGSLSNLFSASLESISTIKGMGRAKYTQLQAIYEMSKRAMNDHFSKHPYLNHIDQLKSLLNLYLKPLPYEVCMILLLDDHFRIIKILSLTQQQIGSIQINSDHVLSLLKQHPKSTGLILAHNHPNGSAIASKDDIESTQRLAQYLRVHQYELHDHFIVGYTGSVYSMVEQNALTTTFRNTKD